MKFMQIGLLYFFSQLQAHTGFADMEINYQKSVNQLRQDYCHYCLPTLPNCQFVVNYLSISDAS